MMYWGNGMGGWGMVLMIVSSLLFWALVIAGMVALVRYAGRATQATSPGGQHAAAQQVLADRYARGEIDEDEYRRRREVLGAAATTKRPGG